MIPHHFVMLFVVVVYLSRQLDLASSPQFSHFGYYFFKIKFIVCICSSS